MLQKYDEVLLTSNHVSYSLVNIHACQVHRRHKGEGEEKYCLLIRMKTYGQNAFPRSGTSSIDIEFTM